METGTTDLVLPSAVLIKPQNLYDIRINFVDGQYGGIKLLWEPKVQLTDGTKIQFYKSLSSGYDNISEGLISGLVFNSL